MTSALTLLAVMLAMQPDSKRSLALAMSTESVSTGTPTASREATGDPTRARMMSRSWIMMSRITSTSVPRALKGLMRCASMNMGSTMLSLSSRSAGLNRSRWPIWRVVPPFCAASMMSAASPVVPAMGFSRRTATPAPSRGTATSAWTDVGTATLAASRLPLR